MSHTKYLIVGCSHAGLTAMETIRLQDSEGAITMVTREETLPYSPTILPYFIAGQVLQEQIFLRDQAYFDKLNVTLLKGAAVVGADSAAKTIRLASGDEIHYEKLLLATGAGATVPPFPGIENVRYQVVRDLNDALKLRETMNQAKSAIVIGAGLIAMHSAENLAHAGLKVSMVVRRKVSLFAYFDVAAAGLIEKIFEDNGVHIATGSGVAKISPSDGGRCVVTLESGEDLTGDVLLLAAGVRPRIEYLEGSGIETDAGILVDNSMRTSAADIWAAGDVAQAPQFFEPGKTVNATLPNAVTQGRVAGMDMVSDPAFKPYSGSSGLNTFNFFGHHAFSVGLATIAEPTEDIEVNTTLLPSGLRYQKLVFQKDRLVGVSAINAALDPGIMRELIRRQTDLGAIKEKFVSAPLETGRLLMSKLWR